MAPGQVGGSPQPPPQPRKGVSPFLIIALVVVALLILVGIGSLFYNKKSQRLDVFTRAKKGSATDSGCIIFPLCAHCSYATLENTPFLTLKGNSFVAHIRLQCL